MTVAVALIAFSCLLYGCAVFFSDLPTYDRVMTAAIASVMLVAGLAAL